MFQNTCTKCGQPFDTKNPNRVVCPNCLYPGREASGYAATPQYGQRPDRPAYNAYPQDRPGDRPAYGPRPSYGDRSAYGDRPSYPPREYPPREGGGYPPREGSGYPPREYPPRDGGPPRYGSRPAYGDRPAAYGDRPAYPPREYPPREGGGYPPREGGYGPRPAYGAGRPPGPRPFGGPRPGGFRPGGGRPGGGRPGGRPPARGPKKLLIPKEVLIELEKLYTPLLPLPNPDVHEVLAEKLGIEPSKAFFGINLIRMKMKLPKLEYPKRKLAVTPDQLMAIEAMYTPYMTMPNPPIGIHKILAKQLKIDEWRVHVAIGLIRKAKNIPRWNTEREDLPPQMKAHLAAIEAPAEEAKPAKAAKPRKTAKAVVDEAVPAELVAVEAVSVETPVAVEAETPAPKKRGRPKKVVEPVDAAG